jgi:hypothetical protein
VSPVKYELGFCIPEDDILHSNRRENFKSYVAITGWTLQRRREVSPMKYELGFYISEDGILHSHVVAKYRTNSALALYSSVSVDLEMAQSEDRNIKE